MVGEGDLPLPTLLMTEISKLLALIKLFSRRLTFLWGLVQDWRWHTVVREQLRKSPGGRVSQSAVLVNVYSLLQSTPLVRMDSKQENPKPEDNDRVLRSPRKGPTLSTSTSSFEALDPHDPQLNHLAHQMFSKTSDWVTGSVFCWRTNSFNF